mgnify:CR=1 FL=1
MTKWPTIAILCSAFSEQNFLLINFAYIFTEIIKIFYTQLELVNWAEFHLKMGVQNEICPRFKLSRPKHRK